VDIYLVPGINLCVVMPDTHAARVIRGFKRNTVFSQFCFLLSVGLSPSFFLFESERRDGIAIERSGVVATRKQTYMHAGVENVVTERFPLITKSSHSSTRTSPSYAGAGWYVGQPVQSNQAGRELRPVHT